ncbi:hypothetical protein BTS2_0253 [Bacillus sp. TS-2]|nr:hypothetical protein BTS2_0253 [Bacillus sp. TS-2]
MKRSKRVITVFASALIFIGILLALVGLLNGTKFSIITTANGFQAVGKEDRLQEVVTLDDFNRIHLDLADADIEVIPSDEFKIEMDKLKYTEVNYSVENNTLVIEDEAFSRFNFAMSFSANIHKTNIKIYVPEDIEFDDINLANKFGDIQLAGITSNQINILTNDGDVTMNNIQSNQLMIKNRFGDLTASEVKAGDIKIEMNDGEAQLDFIESTNTSLENHFGNVTLKNFSSEETELEITDGHLKIDGELLGQTFIHSSFGDVYLVLKNTESALSYQLETSFGDITINGNDYSSRAVSSVDTEHSLNIQSKDGDIEVIFE